jgi:hypothetical protein
MSHVGRQQLEHLVIKFAALFKVVEILAFLLSRSILSLGLHKIYVQSP